MKVLKKGREQKGWTMECICTGKGNGDGGCGAKLLVSEGDMYKTYSCHYDGSNDKYVTFTCPCCGVETDIDDVPGSVWGRLSSKENFFERQEEERKD